jgi:hypothetical protein
MDDLEALYLEGHSFVEIGRRLGKHYKTIKAWLRKRGLTQIDVESKRRKCIHSYDEHYFDEIDRQDKSYWMGFIAADGNIMVDSRKRHYLRLHLCKSDSDHLYKFNDHIQSTYSIKYNKKSCHLNLCGRHVVKSLISNGITPRKTKTLT